MEHSIILALVGLVLTICVVEILVWRIRLSEFNAQVNNTRKLSNKLMSVTGKLSKARSVVGAI